MNDRREDDLEMAVIIQSSHSLGKLKNSPITNLLAHTLHTARCPCPRQKRKNLQIANEQELSLSFKSSIFLATESVIIVSACRTDDFDSWLS